MCLIIRNVYMHTYSLHIYAHLFANNYISYYMHITCPVVPNKKAEKNIQNKLKSKPMCILMHTYACMHMIPFCVIVVVLVQLIIMEIESGHALLTW